MNSIDYIGLDVHKRTISYCVKAMDGTIREEGVIGATRPELTAWAQRRPRRWAGALEATLFSGWIYDHLLPFAEQLQVAHPLMLRAIAASKKKNDRVDARKIADLLRCNLLPACYMAPAEWRDLRRLLRYRSLVVREATRMKNRIAGLLMETGTPYDQQRLHGKAYFRGLLTELTDVPESVVGLLALSRGQLELFQRVEARLRGVLREQELLRERIERLQTIPGVGEIVALTWALETGEVKRFGSIAQAVSYCGLSSAQRASAGKQQRGPISKQRNPHLQTILIEAAKLAPRHNPQLAAVHERELARGNRNRATLAVARKLVAYLMAVDKSGQPFRPLAAAALSAEGGTAANSGPGSAMNSAALRPGPEPPAVPNQSHKKAPATA